MAEWKYRIERIDLQPEVESDAQLEKVFQEYGRQGMGVGAGTARKGGARQPEVSINIQNRKALH